MKTILVGFLQLYFLSSIFCLGVQAQVTWTWLGTTGSYFTDGTTSFLIDPVVSRPGLIDILISTPLKTDDSEVKKLIDKVDMKNVKAVLVTHSHHDHAMDAPSFVRQTSAILMGSRSTANIGRGGGLDEKQIRVVNYGEVVTLGKFKITFLKSVHSPIFMGYQVFSGEISEPLKQPGTAGSYKMGGAYSYLIEHPDGVIYFHPGSQVGPDEVQKKADVLFQGIASRISSEDISKNIISKVEPRVMFPLHFDDFFSPVGDHLKTLIGVDLSEFLATEKRLYPAIDIEVPTFGETRVVLPLK